MIGHFSFELPTRIEFGPGVSSTLVEVLLELGSRRPLVVTDKGVIDAGIFGRIKEHLERGGIEFCVFSSVEPNPKDRDVMNGASAAREFGADSIVAIGGGSPIDCAKGIGVIITHGGKTRDPEGGTAITQGSRPPGAAPTPPRTGGGGPFRTGPPRTRGRGPTALGH
ncbi:MAG TPA: hypothetical protein DDW96_06625, partial [Synergistaceae bacterium]|nr:hypothetical protein [Synergistaceae bacterium]